MTEKLIEKGSERERQHKWLFRTIFISFSLLSHDMETFQYFKTNRIKNLLFYVCAILCVGQCMKWQKYGPNHFEINKKLVSKYVGHEMEKLWILHHGVFSSRTDCSYSQWMGVWNIYWECSRMLAVQNIFFIFYITIHRNFSPESMFNICIPNEFESVQLEMTRLSIIFLATEILLKYLFLQLIAHFYCK